MRHVLWQSRCSLRCRRYFSSQLSSFFFKLQQPKTERHFSIYISELQHSDGEGVGGGGFVRKWFLAESVPSTLQTTFHFQHKHIFLYCLSTRGYPLRLTATLMTILVSCNITVPKKEQLLRNSTFFQFTYISRGQPVLFLHNTLYNPEENINPLHQNISIV